MISTLKKRKIFPTEDDIFGRLYIARLTNNVLEEGRVLRIFANNYKLNLAETLPMIATFHCFFPIVFQILHDQANKPQAKLVLVSWGLSNLNTPCFTPFKPPIEWLDIVFSIKMSKNIEKIIDEIKNREFVSNECLQKWHIYIHCLHKQGPATVNAYQTNLQNKNHSPAIQNVLKISAKRS